MLKLNFISTVEAVRKAWRFTQRQSQRRLPTRRVGKEPSAAPTTLASTPHTSPQAPEAMGTDPSEEREGGQCRGNPVCGNGVVTLQQSCWDEQHLTQLNIRVTIILGGVPTQGILSAMQDFYHQATTPELANFIMAVSFCCTGDCHTGSH